MIYHKPHSILKLKNECRYFDYYPLHRQRSRSSKRKHIEPLPLHSLSSGCLYFRLCQDFQFPDITGTVDTQGSLFAGAAKPTTGSFSWEAKMTNRIGEGSANYGGILTFKSSGSSVLFGKSSTIQPKTFYILTIIKV